MKLKNVKLVISLEFALVGLISLTEENHCEFLDFHENTNNKN